MPVNFVNIPDVLKQNASFCVWKYEKHSGRRTKVPYNPRTGAMARTNDPTTFSDFNTAMKAYAIGGYDGIGYRVSEGIGAIDIDHQYQLQAVRIGYDAVLLQPSEAHPVQATL